MEFFIDTADVEAIRKANDMGFISGVTTNPSLIAKEGKERTSMQSLRKSPPSWTALFPLKCSLMTQKE